MLLPLIQIIIELALTLTLIAALGFGIYVVLSLKNIEQVIHRLEHIKVEALALLREADHDLNKLKIKTELLKSAVKKAGLPKETGPEAGREAGPKTGSVTGSEAGTELGASSRKED